LVNIHRKEEKMDRETIGDFLSDAKEFIGVFIEDRLDDAKDWVMDRIEDAPEPLVHGCMNGYDRIITNTKRSRMKSEMRKILKCCKRFSQEDYKAACDTLNEDRLSNIHIEQTIATCIARIPYETEAGPDCSYNDDILIRDSSNC